MAKLTKYGKSTLSADTYLHICKKTVHIYMKGNVPFRVFVLGLSASISVRLIKKYKKVKGSWVKVLTRF